VSEPQTTNLWMLLEVLAKRRSLIIWFTVVITVIAVAISLVLPKYYRAEALLLPPKDTSLPVAGLAQITEVVSVTKGLNLPVMVTTSDIYARILGSRRVAGNLIERFDLQARYDMESYDETYERLLNLSSFEVTAEGLLRVTCEDTDPVTAAMMVNSFVDELDRLNREIATSRATENRDFIAHRLEQIGQELDSSRAAFEQFQIRNRAVDFDQQTKLAIEQAVQLKVQLADTDINIAIMSGKLSPDNAELQELRRKRAIIAGELSSLEGNNRDSSFFSLPIASIPTLRGEYEELYSRVSVNESLHQTLLSQLEQAKIQENEELPTITVLDWATPPELRNRPKRSIIVLGAFFVSLIVAILAAALLEYLARLRVSRQDDYQRATLFINAFFGWLPGVRKNRK